VFTSLKDVGIVLVICRNIYQETSVDGNPHKVETTDLGDVSGSLYVSVLFLLPCRLHAVGV
jgi:hypothetical protein